MDPFSQLSQLQQNLQAMTKTVAGLENDMLEVLKENTELKVENQLLREKISKLDANKEPAESKSQAGLKSLRNIYDSGYHRESGEDCMFCLDILDNFVNHGQKNRG